MDRSELIEAVQIAINLNLKKQMDGAVLTGPYDPTNWHGTGGVINLSELAEVAISEYEKSKVPCAVCAARSGNLVPVMKSPDVHPESEAPDG